jgi:hypothetical protein
MHPVGERTIGCGDDTTAHTEVSLVFYDRDNTFEAINLTDPDSRKLYAE